MLPHGLPSRGVHCRRGAVFAPVDLRLFRRTPSSRDRCYFPRSPLCPIVLRTDCRPCPAGPASTDLLWPRVPQRIVSLDASLTNFTGLHVTFLSGRECQERSG